MSDTRPYPEKDDTLFKGDLDIALNADISHWNKDFHGYAKGYKDAADLIVHGVINGSRELTLQVSYLVFPVVFLYRQYLELRLKEIILIGNRRNNRSDGFPKHHRIDELWSHAKPHIEAASSEISYDVLEAVENCIKEFSGLDPDGMAFRYPIDREGKFHLPEWTVINLRHLGETMQKIGNFLDDHSEYIYILWQQAEEFRNEY